MAFRLFVHILHGTNHLISSVNEKEIHETHTCEYATSSKNVLGLQRSDNFFPKIRCLSNIEVTIKERTHKGKQLLLPKQETYFLKLCDLLGGAGLEKKQKTKKQKTKKPS
jgi:hypothetical protein